MVKLSQRLWIAFDRAKKTNFGRDERGGITIFVLVFFVLLLVIGGMAVDYQRHDLARADLQNALDRGILAATNSNQLYDPNGQSTIDEQAAEVIYDYMASRVEGSAAVEIATSVTQIGGGRAIVASASRPLNTMFLRMVGINQLDIDVQAGAIQAVHRLEIALVLDVSGSMGWDSTSAPGTKLSQLQVAAKSFIDTVLSADNQAQTLISIVPFSQQVNMPRAMADLYNIDRHHDYSSCIDYHSIDFDTVAMPMNPVTAYVQGQHFRENVGSGNFGCPNANNAITPYSDNAQTLKDAIDALDPETWTATYMGMKWGQALLDTSSRPLVDAMIANGDLSADFAGWPNAWNNTSVRKITVVMSDGQNTRLNEINDDDYDDHSPDWWNSNNPPSGSKIRVIDNAATGEGDVLLKQICDQAKLGLNSTVYTIGFELAGQPAAQAALEDCSSSLTTHYLVEGVDITTAFQNIADEIVNLKLTN